ncbi:N-acetyl-1-D-myo-inositol-2-amino-2-deoxy-alpha-D-glucopyranoside deacetylase [Skermania sp. ID1734]|uniref:N-acetyl-1-D-myo-inositol-2-amino-2-deoxy-alpha- D-glucopyranoside deacetylase n=1 Tax=Skermania sp. ID1734 TaxID=2597516 RepID=UPI00117D196D|nr:N-acetyl-1-D-myo-inositol-2-amino-2-deoxy-alpha-D-glucopyranoside deacetylase [Skermania sp. ID1734]TSE01943.1 N-acetyl-1-D-myo-inositol-2-amino-2-deoxy-alpha-D-glucopyranoside deacetylase [Skermania sp. ID1734]
MRPERSLRSDQGAQQRRLLFVHAHPDDESILTGGTIARYVRAGADVAVVTCTLGEEGEVIGEQWALLAADQADQLGGYRIGELTSALSALGVDGPRFLGGAGRWRDSGMVDTPSLANPRAFVNADIDVLVETLVAAIRQLRPHVVVGYDPTGGYGHPDHIRVHRITETAVVAAATDRFPDAGSPWNVPKYYWAVWPGADGEPATTAIDITDTLDVKRAALRAHATQVVVSSKGDSFALSNGIDQPILASEHYVLVRGTVGAVDYVDLETDLCAGLDG